MGYPKPEKFTQIIHICHGGRGDNSGLSAENAKPIIDGNLWAIPGGSIIEKCYLLIDTAITGSTDIDVGDDDDSDGFIDGSLSVTIGTAGMYGWNAKTAGAYSRVQTAGATDAGDVYVVPNAKYYAADGKTLKADVTGASTAGVARVVVEGFKIS